MKKKFLVFVTLLLTLIMSFSLIACNVDPDGTDPDKKDPSPAPDTNPTQTQIVTVLNEFKNVASAKSLVGTVGASVKMGSETMSFNASLDRRGDLVKVELPASALGYESEGNATVLLDIKYGNIYLDESTVSEDGSGYVLADNFGQGIVDYILAVAKDAIGEVGVSGSDAVSALSGIFTLDSANSKLVASLELKDIVNAVIKPLQTNYKDEGSVLDLVNEYLKLIPTGSTPITLNSLIGSASTWVGSLVQNQTTVATVIDMIDSQLGDDMTVATLIPVIVEAMGGDEDVSDAVLEFIDSIKTRQIAEILAGAIKFVEEGGALMANPVSDDDYVGGEDYPDGGYDDGEGYPDNDYAGEDIMSSYLAMLEQLANYMFNEEVDTSTLVSKINTYGAALVDELDSLHLSVYINEIPDDSEYVDIKTVITKDLMFTELGGKLEISYNEQNKITGVKLVAKSTYTTTGNVSLSFLPSSESAELNVGITSYAATATTEHELTFSQNAGEYLSYMYYWEAYLCGDAQSHSLFLETCGVNVVVSDIQVYYSAPIPGYENIYTSIALPAEKGTVTYDSNTKMFSVSKTLINNIIELEEYEGYCEFDIRFNVEIGGEENEMEYNVFYVANTTLEGLFDVMNQM